MTLAAETSIVIPSYRRPEHLARCLRAVAHLDDSPREVIVVARSDDERTRDVVRSQCTGTRLVLVQEPGVLAAMRAGIAGAKGDLVALLDDDTQVRADWLGRVSNHFVDARVGGVCGRDIVTAPDGDACALDVGRVSEWGRLVGHHHKMAGPVRDVDILKGANVLFRRSVVSLPRGLRGRGAQVHWEVASCLWLRNAGFRVLIDPSAVVLHLPGPRFDSDRRGRPAFGAAFDAGYNVILALCTPRPHLLTRRFAFGILVGDAACPGLVRGLAAAVRHERSVFRLMLPSMLGQTAAALRFTLGARLSKDGFPQNANAPTSRAL